MQIAKIPPERIVIVGQSLGTAVTAAAAEYFANEGMEFAGVVMVASFTDMPNLLNGYKLGGWISTLSPLRRYPLLLKWFQSQIEDTWESASRIANFVRKSKRVRLFLIHALDDYEIPWAHTDALFAAAANATTESGMSSQQISAMKKRSTVDRGDGAFVSTWNAGGNKIIREEILAYGREFFFYCTYIFLLILNRP